MDAVAAWSCCGVSSSTRMPAAQTALCMPGPKWCGLELFSVHVRTCRRRAKHSSSLRTCRQKVATRIEWAHNWLAGTVAELQDERGPWCAIHDLLHLPVWWVYKHTHDDGEHGLFPLMKMQILPNNMSESFCERICCTSAFVQLMFHSAFGTMLCCICV